MSGLDLEELRADRFMNVILNFYVEDRMTEYAEDRDKIRTRISRLISGAEPLPELDIDYNGTGSYSRSNDTASPSTPSEPRPYIPPTVQTEDGYVGLMPPVGVIR